MKKLRNKVFSLITIILTLFLITMLFINNYQNYKRSKDNINNNLHRIIPGINEKERKNNKEIEKKDISIEPERDQRKIFMDSIVYTIILDDNKNIVEIVNHYTEEQDENKIKEEAKKILNEKDIKETYIGNLYYNKYSYAYNGNTLIIIDNTSTNEKLRSDLIISLIIFIVLEAIILLISTLLTKWITKPVEESFENQKRFIADASHELKTPLAVIMASSESLENDKNSEKLIDNIKNESERMNKLILNLLDLAKVENGETKELSPHNISKIVEKSVLTFESLSFEKEIELNYNIDDDINIKCDSDEIKELISILLDNAIKHCKKKGKIEVNLNSDKSYVYLNVINEGNPIPKGEEEKIFERFYRVDKARNRNENRYGLGLAIAKKIVEKHNGKISAKSEDGFTTFKIIIKKK